MKKAIFKKALSVVLALCMIVTLFTGISLVQSSAAANDTKMLYVHSTSVENRFGYRPASGKGSLVKDTKYRLSLDWENIKNAPFGDTTFLLYVYDGAWKKVNSSTSTSEWKITSYPLEHGMHYDIDFTTKASSSDFRELVFWFGDLEGNIADMEFKTANWVLYTRDANNNLTDTNYTLDFDQVSFRNVGNVSILDNFPSNASQVRGDFCRKTDMSSDSEFVSITDGYFAPTVEEPSEPVETTGDRKMVYFQGGNAYGHLAYLDSNLKLIRNTTYVFSIDQKDVVGEPSYFFISDKYSNKLSENYTTGYTDTVSGSTRTITFKMTETITGVRIKIGAMTNSASRNFQGKYANVKLVEQGKTGSLIYDFSSNSIVVNQIDSEQKWDLRGRVLESNQAYNVNTAPVELFSKNDKNMFYIEKATTAYSGLSTYAFLQPNTQYTLNFDWKSHAGSEPTVNGISYLTPPETEKMFYISQGNRLVEYAPSTALEAGKRYTFTCKMQYDTEISFTEINELFIHFWYRNSSGVVRLNNERAPSCNFEQSYNPETFEYTASFTIPSDAATDSGNFFMKFGEFEQTHDGERLNLSIGEFKMVCNSAEVDLFSEISESNTHVSTDRAYDGKYRVTSTGMKYGTDIQILDSVFAEQVSSPTYVYSVENNNKADLEAKTTNGKYSYTFTTPANLRTDDSKWYNFKINLRHFIKDDAPFYYARGSAYFGNFSLTKKGETQNLLLNGDLSISETGDISQSTNKNAIGWDVNIASDKYDKLAILEQPEGFFTNAGMAADKIVEFKGGNSTRILQDFVLKANTSYRLTYKVKNINAAEGATIQLFNTEGNYDPASTSSFDAENLVKTIDFRTSELRDYFTNATIAFTIQHGGSDVEIDFTDVKLYELSGNNTVGGNLVNNGGFFFDEIGNDKEALFAWNYDGDHSGTTVNVVDYENNYFIKAPATFEERLNDVKKWILSNSGSFSKEYADVNSDTNVTILDLVKTKELETGADMYAESWKNIHLNGNNATDPSLYADRTTKYYVDSNAASGGNGTIESPYDSLSDISSKSGSNVAVLFKCGSVFRPSSVGTGNVFTAKSGVFYGSYGEGAKPVISGSAKNYGGTANQSSWTQVSEMENVWQYNLGTTTADAGIVVYNNGELIGSMTKTKADVENGAIGDFCHKYQVVDNVQSSATNSNYIYVKSDENPALKWNSIEIGVGRHVVALESNTTCDNIAVMYTGKHGFNGSNVNNVTIQNCYVSYIGGSFQDSRLGNGIQFGQTGSNLKVLNTYVNECYDAGITFQTWSGTASWSNLEFTNNLVENCEYAFEWFIYNSDDNVNGVTINNNIFRKAGYGWGYDERVGFGPDISQREVALFRVGQDENYTAINNFNFTNNILDSSKRQLVFWNWNGENEEGAYIEGFNASGNSFYQGVSEGNLVNIYNYSSHQMSIGSAGVLKALEYFEGKTPTGVAMKLLTNPAVIIK